MKGLLSKGPVHPLVGCQQLWDQLKRFFLKFLNRNRFLMVTGDRCQVTGEFLVLVLLSAHVKRFSVTRTRDFHWIRVFCRGRQQAKYIFLCFTSLHLFIKAVGYVLSFVLNLRFNLLRCPGLKPPPSLLIASTYLLKLKIGAYMKQHSTLSWLVH